MPSVNDPFYCFMIELDAFNALTKGDAVVVLRNPNNLSDFIMVGNCKGLWKARGHCSKVFPITERAHIETVENIYQLKRMLTDYYVGKWRIWEIHTKVSKTQKGYIECFDQIKAHKHDKDGSTIWGAYNISGELITYIPDETARELVDEGVSLTSLYVEEAL